jgi:CHAT domain-containing protein/tetratricopeptide (TPR) repeat protein
MTPTLIRVVCVFLLADGILRPSICPSAQRFANLQIEILSDVDSAHYQLAEIEAERLFLQTQSQFSGSSPMSLRAASLLTRVRVLNGHGASADTRALAEKIVSLHESMLGASAPPLALSLKDLGDVYAASGDYGLAIGQYRRALSLREHVTSDPGATAAVLEALGESLAKTGQYDEAGQTLDRAIATFQHSKPTPELLIRALERKAFVLLQQGDYPAARQLLQRTLDLTTSRAANLSLTARVLDTLGNLCWFEGNVRDSERYLRRAIHMAEGVMGQNHPEVARYLLDLADTRGSIGYLSEARSLQERAVAIVRRVFPAHSLDVIGAQNNLANTLLDQGHYPQARVLYDESLRALQSRFGPEHLLGATLLYNLALLDGHVGEFDAAEDRLQRAIALWERALGTGHPYVARALDSLAEVFNEKGDFAGAQRLYQRALAIRRQRLQPDHREVAETLINLGRTTALVGDLAGARAFSNEALESLERSKQSRDPIHAKAVLTSAEVSLMSGDSQLAVSRYERALSRTRELLGDSHPDVAATRTGLAIALLRAGRSREAFSEALRAEAISREHLRLTSESLAEHEALSYAGHRTRALDVTLSVVEHERSCQDCATRALEAIIRSRAVVLDEMAERHRTTSESTNADVRQLVLRLSSAKERVASLMVRGPASDAPQNYQSMLAGARREQEQAERALADRSAVYRAELRRTDIDLADVKRALPRDAALVGFVRYSDSTKAHSAAAQSYIAFVLRSDRVVAVPLMVASVVDARILRWRREVEFGESSPDTVEARYRLVASQLRRSVWDPVAPYLVGTRYVFLVLDGPLNLVSFASLPVGKGRYLLDEAPAIHYVSAERDLVELPQAAPSHGGLLAVGGPDFGYESSRPDAPQRSSTVEAAASACPEVNSLVFGALPAARLEAEDIVATWQREVASKVPNAQLLTGQEASEAAVKRLAPHRRILHFATHGFFLGDACRATSAATRGVGGLSAMNQGTNRWSNDPLTRSGLALAGANRRDDHRSDAEDGILTAEEVTTLNLGGTDWAVLSACDTGVGTITTGEGVLGLRRAFQVAGVRTVIMSLWSVDDEWSRRWMDALYEGRLREHLSTVDAVRRAGLVLLRDRRSRGLSTHPFYWAGFVAAGDWR